MKKTYRIKTVNLFVVLMGFICAFIFLGCDHETNYITKNLVADVDYETYRFPTRNVSGFRELIIEDATSNAEGIGYLFLPEANFPDQLADAFAALNSLQRHPFVDGNKIGIMGYSMGGISTILAAYENIAAACSKNSI